MQSSQKTIQKKEEIKLPTEKPTKNTSSNTDMGNIWVKTASAKPETCISTGILADIPKLSPMMREYDFANSVDFRINTEVTTYL